MHFISFDLAINKRELFSHTRQQVQGEGEVLFDFEMMMSIYMKKKKKVVCKHMMQMRIGPFEMRLNAREA